VSRGERTSTETAYLITSLPPEQAGALELLALNRGHWGIENRLHWVLDAVLGEDRDRARVGAIPLAMRLLRGAVLTLQRAAGHTSPAAAKTRFAMRPLLAVACVAMRVARGPRSPRDPASPRQSRASALRASPARSLTSR
jgi:hypothetical protein